MASLKINKKNLICELFIFFLCLSDQAKLLFGISEGPLFYFFSFSRWGFSVILFAFYISKKKIVEHKDIKQFIKIILPLILLSVSIDIVAKVCGTPMVVQFGLRYWARALSLLLNKCLIFFDVVLIWGLRGEQSLQCLSTAFIMDEFFVLFCGIVQIGVDGIFNSIINVLTFSTEDNFFEIHSVTFALGLLIIYYLFFYERRKNNIPRIIIMIVFFILGEKRIAILAIAVSLCFLFVINKKGLSKVLIKSLGLIISAVSVTFLVLLYNNDFFSLLVSNGINSQGRNYIYTYFLQKTEFSPNFIGWGSAGISKAIEIFSSEYDSFSWLNNIHSDILKMYINYGFFGFIIWLYLNLISLPNKIFDIYGKKSATIYITLSIFMFICYFTDNIEEYLVVQLTLYLIILSNYMYEKGKFNRKI